LKAISAKALWSSTAATVTYLPPLKLFKENCGCSLAIAYAYKKSIVAITAWKPSTFLSTHLIISLLIEELCILCAQMRFIGQARDVHKSSFHALIDFVCLYKEEMSILRGSTKVWIIWKEGVILRPFRRIMGVRFI
jgi:hypothetical protein